MSAKTNLLHPRDELMQTMDRIYRYRMTTTSGGNLSIRDADVPGYWLYELGDLGPEKTIIDFEGAPSDPVPQYIPALRRMNQQHGTYPISNKEFLYVLTTFVFEPIRWMERFAWRPMIRQAAGYAARTPTAAPAPRRRSAPLAPDLDRIRVKTNRVSRPAGRAVCLETARSSRTGRRRASAVPAR